MNIYQVGINTYPITTKKEPIKNDKMTNQVEIIVGKKRPDIIPLILNIATG